MPNNWDYTCFWYCNKISKEETNYHDCLIKKENKNGK